MQQVKVRLAVGVLVALTGFQWSDPLAVGNGLSPSANVMVPAGMPKTGLPPYTRSSVTPWSVIFSDSGLAAGANARFTGKPLSATCSVSWAKARRASPLPWPYIVIFTGAPISQATKSTRTANADGEVRLIWLGALGGSTSRANAVSTNGWVVGYSYDAAENRRAFRWTASGGMQDLGTIGGYPSEATAVSADGSVVVGTAGWRAFRWTASQGMQDLGTLGGSFSAAYGVSADGSVVVGGAENAWGYRRAFRWSTTAGMQDLGTLGGGWSEAYGVSADGSVVVGQAADGNGNGRAFRWTASGGMQDLGTLGGRWSEAYGVSSDGSVVVGKAGTSSELRRLWVGAFRWTTSGGMQDLNKVYAGALSSDGSILREARAVSPNGRYIVGIGLTEGKRYLQAFLLDAGVPVP